MVVTFSGIVMVVKASFQQNASPPMVTNSFGKVTLVIFKLAPNDLYPRLVTPSGITIGSKDSQLWNVKSSILVMFFGSVTFSNAEQQKNEP